MAFYLTTAPTSDCDPPLSTTSFRGFFIPKAWNMAELFIESEYHSIPHQFAEFRVANIDYIIDFSSD